MQLILNENQENNVFTFDEELNVHLLSGLKNKLSENTNKTILHKNMTHSVAYQERFLEKVQEKLKNEEKKPHFLAKEPNYYTNPVQFVKNLGLTNRHINVDNEPYLDVKLVIYCGTELRLGLLVGCWFLSFNESGLVSCSSDHLPPYPSFSMSLATGTTDKEISQLMTHLTEYLIACNGSMEYNKELFNEAHFIKYWAELYGVWKPNEMSALARVGFEYLDSYCKTQTLPNTLICSPDIIYCSNKLNFQKLCATHEVAIEQADVLSDVILRADEVQQFEDLFCKYLQYNPNINSIQKIDMMLQVAKWLVIKQKDSSNIALKNLSGKSPRIPMYNWPRLDIWMDEMSKKYASKALLPENTVIEQQAVVPKTVVQPPVMNPPRQIYSGVLNANKTTEMLHKKIEQLKVYLSMLKPHQQWLNTLKAMSKNTVISQKQQQPQTSMFFKPQNQNNLAYCIGKLKESISTMEQSNLILESQIKIIEVKCQEARNALYALPELPQLLLLEKEKVQLKQAIAAHKERISTLSEMSQGKAITMQQYQQLIIMDVFKQNEIIANYQNIISDQNIFNK